MSLFSSRRFPEDDSPISISPPAQKVINSKFITTSMNAISYRSDFPYAGEKFIVKKAEEREVSFYECAQQGHWPARLIPQFYGRTEDGTAIQIENITYNFDKPCVIELKMGARVVESSKSNLFTRLKTSALHYISGSKSNHCSLEGFSMHRTLENKRVRGTKAQCHSISPHRRVSLQDILTFFLTDQSNVRTDIALRFQTAIEDILKQTKTNKNINLTGSSLLLIYNNDNSAPYMQWARALRKLHLINHKAHLSEDAISGLMRKTRCDVRIDRCAQVENSTAEIESQRGYIGALECVLRALRGIRLHRERGIFSMNFAVLDAIEEDVRSEYGAGSSLSRRDDEEVANAELFR